MSVAAAGRPELLRTLSSSGNWTGSAILPFWAGFTAVAVVLSWFAAAAAGAPPSAPPLVARAAGHAAFWAALTPAVLLVSRVVTPALGLHWFIGLHLLALGAFVWASASFGSWLDLALGGSRGWWDPSLARVEAAILAYVTVLGAERAHGYGILARNAENGRVELERRLGQVRLQMLSLQLHPHFLFNTLNTITELVHHDPKGADEMLTRLVRLLRITYQQVGHQIVPFRQELELLKAYLEIEQVRFQGRLEVKWQCTQEALAAGVPTLVWQPALENAIRHGVGRLGEPGRLRLTANRVGDELVLEIEDNGKGVPEPGSLREGVGISNIRGRVQQFYGPRATFTLRPGSDGGTVASLRIPYEPCGSPHTPVPPADPTPRDGP